MSDRGFLDGEDLRQLTGMARVSAQAGWLKEQGIPYRTNGKDALVVCWTHVHAWIEGRDRPASRGINWSALNA